MPAEWEPHAATWIAWPHNLDTWPGKFAPVPAIYVEMVRALQAHEQVNICVNDAEAALQVRQYLSGASVAPRNIKLYEFPTNDTWARDHGPIFLTRQLRRTHRTRCHRLDLQLLGAKVWAVGSRRCDPPEDRRPFHFAAL